MSRLRDHIATAPVRGEEGEDGDALVVEAARHAATHVGRDRRHESRRDQPRLRAVLHLARQQVRRDRAQSAATAEGEARPRSVPRAGACGAEDAEGAMADARKGSAADAGGVAMAVYILERRTTH